MEENNLSQLKEREQEIEVTLKNLSELVEIRNHVLIVLEKNVLRRTVKQMFSYLNVGSRGNMFSSMLIIKKNFQLDLKMQRRGLFYLHKRKRKLEEELQEVKENIEKLEVSAA